MTCGWTGTKCSVCEGSGGDESACSACAGTGEGWVDPPAKAPPSLSLADLIARVDRDRRTYEAIWDRYRELGEELFARPYPACAVPTRTENMWYTYRAARHRGQVFVYEGTTHRPESLPAAVEFTQTLGSNHDLALTIHLTSVALYAAGKAAGRSVGLLSAAIHESLRDAGQNPRVARVCGRTFVCDEDGWRRAAECELDANGEVVRGC